MYLQISAQDQSRECVGEGNLCKGIFAFVVVGFKQSIPLVVQTISEITFNGHWLAEYISDNIDNLIKIGICVQGIVTDYTSYKV